MSLKGYGRRLILLISGLTWIWRFYCFLKSYVELMRLIMWQKDKINMSPLSSFSWGSVWLIPILAVFHASVCGDDRSFVLFLLGGISVVYTEL